jgi:hypothetical protein
VRHTKKRENGAHEDEKKEAKLGEGSDIEIVRQKFRNNQENVLNDSENAG